MVIAEVGGVRLYVQNLVKAVVGIAARDGKLLWRYHKVSGGTANVATPVVRGEHIFVASGFGTGCALLKLSADRPAVSIQEVYFRKEFQSVYGGMPPVCDHVYAGNSGGFQFADPTCFDWQTGKIRWQQKGPGEGGVATIAADGHIYLRFRDGLMVLAEANPAGFCEKGRFQPPDRSKLPAWSVPVLAHGRLFLRDQNVLCCYDVRAQPPARATFAPRQRTDAARQPDAVFVPSPSEVINAMLDVAHVTKDDVVYDLGCGDGRIVIEAAKQRCARAVGVEMDPELVKQARQEAANQGVQEQVSIREQDLFSADFREATVVTLYLLPYLNARLRPQLDKLRPGARIVSHAFAIPGVQPDRVVRVPSPDGQEHVVYLFVTPLRSVPATPPSPREP
jgi:SAM-dependent methyltransferase